MKKVKIAVTILLLFGLGFLREFIFENINTHLYYSWKKEINPYLPNSLGFLERFSYWELYYSKFALIVFFSILFLVISVYLIQQFFSDSIFRRITILFFAGIFTLSTLIFLVGIIIGSADEAYGISRQLIEFIQSPLAAFFLIPSYHIYQKNRLPNQ